MTSKKINIASLISIIGILIFTLFSQINGYAIDVKIDNSAIEAAQKQVRDAQQQAQNAINQAKSQIQESKTTSVISKCETITTNIETQITRNTQGKDLRLQSVESIRNKLNDLIKNLESKNFDTTGLRNNSTTLGQKIETYTKAHDGYITTLTTTKSSTCGKSQGEFLSSLQLARNDLKNVRDSVNDIQKYIRDTIRPDVEKVRDQLNK